MSTRTTSVPTERPAPPRLGRSRSVVAAATVAIAAVFAAIIFVGGNGGDNPAAAPLDLSLGTGAALASCLPLDVEILGTMSPAFAGTATAVEDDLITLDVDRWYTGGDAAIVQLHAQSGQAALIAGFDFAVGQRYLITAAEGSVNFCGYSGPATAELTSMFDEAFTG